MSRIKPTTCLTAIERDPLAGRLGGKPRFEVGEDGTALIELVPTTKTGEVVLTFQLSDRQRQEVRVWLTPGKRDWILVGFAQGTLGHKQLSGNHEALKDVNADDKLFDESRLAFYAKGEIKGEYLLTLAYDTAKERGLPQSRGRHCAETGDRSESVLHAVRGCNRSAIRCCFDAQALSADREGAVLCAVRRLRHRS